MFEPSSAPASRCIAVLAQDRRQDRCSRACGSALASAAGHRADQHRAGPEAFDRQAERGELPRHAPRAGRRPVRRVRPLRASAAPGWRRHLLASPRPRATVRAPAVHARHAGRRSPARPRLRRRYRCSPPARARCRADSACGLVRQFGGFFGPALRRGHARPAHSPPGAPGFAHAGLRRGPVTAREDRTQRGAGSPRAEPIARLGLPARHGRGVRRLRTAPVARRERLPQRRRR